MEGAGGGVSIVITKLFAVFLPKNLHLSDFLRIFVPVLSADTPQGAATVPEGNSRLAGGPIYRKRRYLTLCTLTPRNLAVPNNRQKQSNG